MERFFNPLNDFIFGKLFGEKGSEFQLISLLNAILYPTGDEKIVSVIINENRNLTPDFPASKLGIVDIRGKTNSGAIFNIEVQRANEGNMELRSPYYVSILFSRSIEKGDDFAKIPKVIGINILDYVQFNNLEKFHTVFHLREDETYHLLTDHMEIHFIEVPKFRKLKHKDINHPLHRWLMFFDKNISEELLKELNNMDSAILKANNKLDYLATDDETIRMYESREMFLHDQASKFNYALKEGIQQGIQKGMQQGKQLGRTDEKLDVLKISLKENLPFSLIEKLTGFSAQEIERMQKELYYND